MESTYKGECHIQRPVNFMTTSQLGNLNDGQAVRKAVFEMVFRLPERQGVIKREREKSWVF